jgi:hypothetical protein
MKKIPLTQGKFALVDDEDYEDLIQFKWYAHRCGNIFYAARTIRIGKRQTVERMHRRILKLKTGDSKHTDHANRNGFDNQKKNIRICTKKENCRNRLKSRNNTSGFKGVFWYKPTKKWRAQIQINYKHKHLGYFGSKIEAAKAYNNAAIKYFGKFANLNIIKK